MTLWHGRASTRYADVDDVLRTVLAAQETSDPTMKVSMQVRMHACISARAVGWSVLLGIVQCSKNT